MTTQDSKNQFRIALEEHFKMAGHPKAEILFDLAWGIGHSQGFEEVQIHYEDFHQLITPVERDNTMLNKTLADKAVLLEEIELLTRRVESQTGTINRMRERKAATS